MTHFPNPFCRLSWLMAFVAVVVLLFPALAHAAPPETTAGIGPAFAEGWSFSSLFGSFASRSRVIQFCAVVMCLALFIMMKK